MERRLLWHLKKLNSNQTCGIMPYEMFPLESMDKFLKLKLEMVYRDLPIEQGRQQFEEMKQEPVEVLPLPLVKVRRKLRIPSGESK